MYLTLSINYKIMRNKLIVSLLFLFVTSAASAQLCYKTLQKNEEVKVKYKWKEKDGKQELYVKFKTLDGSDLNLDLELGFFLNGVQKENGLINTCIKRYFWNNWFRPIYVIQLDDFTKSDIESDQFTLEVLEFIIEKVKQCEPTHD